MGMSVFINSKYCVRKLLATLALVGTAVLTASLQSAVAKPRTLRVAYYVPATHIYAKGAIEPFLKEVTARAKGDLRFTVFPAGQLGHGPDAISMVQHGVADIVFMTTVYHAQELPASQYLALPHGIDGMTSANIFWRATHEPGVVKDEWDKTGIVLLSAYANPPSEFHSTDIPLDSPAALKGQKMRAPGEILTLIAEAVEGVSVEITTSDQYEALQRGLVKTLNYTFASWDAFKLQELLRHTTVGLNVYSTNPGLVMSRKTLDSLTPEQREIVLKAGRDYSVIGERAVLAAEKAAFDKLVAGGLKVHKWSDADKTWLNGKFAKIRDHWVKSATTAGIDGAAVASQFNKFKAEASAEPEQFPAYAK
jgi:TRAP-type C4-dicarboxylate transport system substrate-binding protein